LITIGAANWPMPKRSASKLLTPILNMPRRGNGSGWWPISRDATTKRFENTRAQRYTEVFLIGGPIDYYKWSAIFGRQWMKVLTFVVIVSLLWHVWVGMRDIWMDYIKPVWIRLALQVATIVWLVGCTGWAVQVLWRL
jgi:succinate dehydrogenase hydrophobic membrane anchor protein